MSVTILEIENFVNCKFLYITVLLEQVEINLFFRTNNHNVEGFTLDVFVKELGCIFECEILNLFVNILTVVVVDSEFLVCKVVPENTTLNDSVDFLLLLIFIKFLFLL